MEKYILVPHSKYDALLRQGNKTNAQPDLKTNPFTAPPPGLPADDIHASQGSIISDKEAEHIHKQLVDLGYNQEDNNHADVTDKQTPDQSNSKVSDNNWADAWRSL